jgi:hypothetical protein
MIVSICALLAVFVPGWRPTSLAAPATCLSQSALEQQAGSANLLEQSPEQVNQKSNGCVSCHTAPTAPQCTPPAQSGWDAPTAMAGNAQVLPAARHVAEYNRNTSG